MLSHADRPDRPDRAHPQRLEIGSALLRAPATVATAWTAYQSRQWTGEQAQNTSRATADRIAHNRYAAVANRDVQIDVATLVQWLDARGIRAAILGAGCLIFVAVVIWRATFPVQLNA